MCIRDRLYVWDGMYVAAKWSKNLRVVPNFGQTSLLIVITARLPIVHSKQGVLKVGDGSLPSPAKEKRLPRCVSPAPVRGRIMCGCVAGGRLL